MRELNTIQLTKLLQKDKITSKIFKGVYPSDRLPTINSFPACLIINTDDSKGPGEHWVALYINSSGMGYFYDPFGINPSIYNFSKYLDRTCRRWTWSRAQEQSIFSNLCGYFSVLFLLFKARGMRVRLSDKLISRYFSLL